MLKCNFSPFPELTSERLLLRQIGLFDADAVFELRSHPDVMKYLDRPPAASIDDAISHIDLIKDAIANNQGITWGIHLKSDPQRLIGSIGFWRIMKEHYRAEIGYVLHPGFHGKGIMSEAMDVVLQYGFETMGLHSVEANVNPNNLASIGLLKKAGFVREGYFKENYYYNGKFYDSAIYSLLAPAKI